jgi:hypothetical protein
MGLSQEQVETTQRVFASSEGKAYFGFALQAEYDKTVIALLYAPRDEAEILRGKARALYEQMKQIHDCVSYNR